MRLVLNLQGPDFEVSLNGNSLILSSNENVIRFDRSHLPTVIAQLELLGRMVEVSGPAEATATAPSAAAGVSPVVETLRRRTRRVREAAEPVESAAASAPTAAAEPAAAPAKRGRKPGSGKKKVDPQGPRLHDHLYKYLTEKGPSTLEDLISYVKRRKLSDAKNLKLATTIALGRERTRFAKLSDGRWEAI